MTKKNQMPADPLNAVDFMLEQLNLGFPEVHKMPPAEVRAFIASQPAPPVNPDGIASTEDVQLDSGLTARVYRPSNQEAGSAAVLFFHGGGFVFCGIDTHDDFCRSVSRSTGAVVVSVEYRLAPENPYPAAIDDGYGALNWLAKKAADYNADPSRIYVMGDSAGGNISAALCLMARDRKGPTIAGQVLLYPVIAPDFTTESYDRFGVGYYNTTENMRYYWKHYLGDEKLPEPPDYAAPILAESHHDLPPAIVVLAGRDPLFSEGEDYAEALRTAGVPVRVRNFPDMFHGFLTMPGFKPSEEAAEVLWADLNKLFSSKQG